MKQGSDWNYAHTLLQHRDSKGKMPSFFSGMFTQMDESLAAVLFSLSASDGKQSF